MPGLAINGGERVRTKPWPQWPVWDEREIAALDASRAEFLVDTAVGVKNNIWV